MVATLFLANIAVAYRSSNRLERLMYDMDLLERAMSTNMLGMAREMAEAVADDAAALEQEKWDSDLPEDNPADAFPPFPKEDMGTKPESMDDDGDFSDDDDVAVGDNFIELLFLGEDGCTDSSPCALCQGDCDSDAECGNGLRCFHRDGDEDVPLCEGEDQAPSSADYCVLSEDVVDAPAPAVDAPAPVARGGDAEDFAMMFRLEFLGKDACTDANPCEFCQGDCDSDAQCGEGLICFHRDAHEDVPLCEGEGNAPSGADFCTVDIPSDDDVAAPVADAPAPVADAPAPASEAAVEAAEILERLVREARWGYRW